MQPYSQPTLGDTYQEIIQEFRALKDETRAQFRQIQAQFQQIQQTETQFQQTLTRMGEQIVENSMTIATINGETQERKS